ncbi:MAG: helix-turn-helix domain-containing protein [Verrucomicrobiota bacterium]
MGSSFFDPTAGQCTTVAALTVPQAAAISQLCEKTIYDAIKRGLLGRVPHIRVIRIPIAEFTRFLTGHAGQLATCKIAKVQSANEEGGRHE